MFWPNTLSPILSKVSSDTMAHAVLGQRGAHYGALRFLALTRLKKKKLRVRKAPTFYSEVISIKPMVNGSVHWVMKQAHLLMEPKKQKANR